MVRRWRSVIPKGLSAHHRMRPSLLTLLNRRRNSLACYLKRRAEGQRKDFTFLAPPASQGSETLSNHLPAHNPPSFDLFTKSGWQALGLPKKRRRPPSSAGRFVRVCLAPETVSLSGVAKTSLTQGPFLQRWLASFSALRCKGLRSGATFASSSRGFLFLRARLSRDEQNGGRRFSGV